jgi:hypothetical protein
VKTSSWQLKPDLCQTLEHKTDRLTPNSRQTQIPPDSTVGATIPLFTIGYLTVKSMIFAAKKKKYHCMCTLCIVAKSHVIWA